MICHKAISEFVLKNSSLAP
jgi:hypothetical protein